MSYTEQEAANVGDYNLNFPCVGLGFYKFGREGRGAGISKE